VARTILVIDDEPELVKLLDYNLSKAGYLVLSARDGESGLAAARKHAPDAIILDVMMPGLDGWEVCKRLRQDPVDLRAAGAHAHREGGRRATASWAWSWGPTTTSESPSASASSWRG
jgi:DNA-binding response OmpR family regulator